MKPTLRLHIRVDSQRTTLVFRQLPVHIGRDKSNECPLEFEFVSRRHAHLELEDGALYLCDDGSMCGTFVRGGAERLPSHGRVRLDDGDEFQLGRGIGSTVTIRAELHDDTTVDPLDDTLDEKMTIPPEAPEAHDTQPYASQRIKPQDVDADALRRQFQDAFESQRHAWFEARHALLQALTELDAEHSKTVLATLLAECPWLGADGEIQRVAAERGVAATTPGADAEVALRRLRDLASAHLPFAPPLDGVEAISRFATRLDLVMRIVFEGVDALRVAFQYETDRAAEDVHNRFDPACALDWTRSDSHARGPLERVFTGLLAHRAQLTKEVAECFSRLAPAAIEANARLAIGPLKHRTLWRQYCEEYAALLGHAPGVIENVRPSGIDASDRFGRY